MEMEHKRVFFFSFFFVFFFFFFCFFFSSSFLLFSITQEFGKPKPNILRAIWQKGADCCSLNCFFFFLTSLVVVGFMCLYSLCFDGFGCLKELKELQIEEETFQQLFVCCRLNSSFLLRLDRFYLFQFKSFSYLCCYLAFLLYFSSFFFLVLLFASCYFSGSLCYAIFSLWGFVMLMIVGGD